VKSDIHYDKDMTTLKLITFVPLFVCRITNKDTFNPILGRKRRLHILCGIRAWTTSFFLFSWSNNWAC